MLIFFFCIFFFCKVSWILLGDTRIRSSSFLQVYILTRLEPVNCYQSAHLDVWKFIHFMLIPAWQNFLLVDICIFKIVHNNRGAMCSCTYHLNTKDSPQSGFPCVSQRGPCPYRETDSDLVRSKTKPCVSSLAACEYLDIEADPMSTLIYCFPNCSSVWWIHIKICSTPMKPPNVCTKQFVCPDSKASWSTNDGLYPLLKSTQGQKTIITSLSTWLKDLWDDRFFCSSSPTLWSTSGGALFLWNHDQGRNP